MNTVLLSTGISIGTIGCWYPQKPIILGIE